jgi:hypothetical protein
LFLENLLKHSDITISELLRVFVLKLRSGKYGPGKHQG